MCIDCWKHYGSPEIVNDITTTLASLISLIYEYHGAGGHLHIVIDDWNLDDDSIKFCLHQIEENHYNYSKEQVESERACAVLMLNSSLDERASALALERTFFDA